MNQLTAIRIVFYDLLLGIIYGALPLVIIARAWRPRARDEQKS